MIVDKREEKRGMENDRKWTEGREEENVNELDMKGVEAQK